MFAIFNSRLAKDVARGIVVFAVTHLVFDVAQNVWKKRPNLKALVSR
jgi:hypothetical protein